MVKHEYDYHILTICNYDNSRKSMKLSQHMLCFYICKQVKLTISYHDMAMVILHEFLRNAIHVFIIEICCMIPLNTSVESSLGLTKGCTSREICVVNNSINFTLSGNPSENQTFFLVNWELSRSGRRQSTPLVGGWWDSVIINNVANIQSMSAWIRLGYVMDT